MTTNKIFKMALSIIATLIMLPSIVDHTLMANASPSLARSLQYITYVDLDTNTSSDSSNGSITISESQNGTKNLSSYPPSNNSDYAAIKYEAIREQFLKIWNTLGFHPLVVTFVNATESSFLGSGQYQVHSNTFKPGENIVLYVQPIGFGHKQIEGKDGEKLFVMNFTADILISAQNGTILGGGQNIPISNLVSHYQNTEMYMHLLVTQSSPLPKGNYVINYRVTDETTGKDFDIVKNIRIA
jgi:hypothetical protein